MIKKAGVLFLVVIASASAIFLMGLWWPLTQIEAPRGPGSILIQSVNIVDVVSGEVLVDRAVLISDNRIVAIDSAVASMPDVELIIDGKGKYLIPGLWDMHTHSNKLSPWIHHPLLIAHGVTSIRDMSGHLGVDDSYWAGTTDRLRWNELMEKGKIVSPRYPLQSSYQINGENAVPGGYPDFFKMERTTDVPQLLEYYREDKTDFIKVYSEINPMVYQELMATAPDYGMHVAGHKPLAVSLRDAVILGQRSFEHGRVFIFECFPEADGLRTSTSPVNFYREQKSEMILKFDTLEAIELMSLMSTHQSYWVPTLQTLKSAAKATEPSFVNTPNLRFIPSIQKNLWWDPDMNAAAKYNESEAGKGLNQRLLGLSRYLVSLAHDQGVPIMAGTDLTDSYTFPGISLHDELEELVISGLTPLEALQSATVVPSHFAGVAELGRVAEDMRADIILLNANPLEDISNTRSIDAVFLNGNYYSRDTLDAMIRESESVASLWHLNFKYLYALLASPLIRKQLAD